jgi:sulfate adenylyltransferase
LFTLEHRQLDELELVLSGVTGQRRYDGALAILDGWPVPIRLDVDAEMAARLSPGSLLELQDREGVVVAGVTVNEIWPAEEPSRSYVAGDIQPRAPIERAAFAGYRRTCAETREQLSAVGTAGVVAVPIATPLIAPDIAGIAALADSEGDCTLLLLPVVGEAAPRMVDADGLLACTEIAARELAPRPVVVTSLPITGRPTVEELAAAAKAHGATHVLSVESSADQVVPILAAGEQIPAELASPELAVELARRVPPCSSRGLVVFFTGLSGSGKSTLARALDGRLRERSGRLTTLLDGDVVRRHLSAGLGFSPEDRDRNILRIGWVAAEIARHRGVAICAPIAPYDATRRLVRAMVEEVGEFVLVHIATPLQVCEERDRKGLYVRARAGELIDFTGIDAPYERPRDADVVIDTAVVPVDAAVHEILAHLVARGLLHKDVIS